MKSIRQIVDTVVDMDHVVAVYPTKEGSAVEVRFDDGFTRVIECSDPHGVISALLYPAERPERLRPGQTSVSFAPSRR